MKTRQLHGMSKCPEYQIWCGAKKRCSNQSCHQYQYYGARGIKMHPAWEDDFLAFYKYVGPRPEGTELDRIDNDKGYEPGNVKWVSHANNMRNRSNNATVKYQGKEVSIEAYAASENILYGTAWNRAKNHAHMVNGAPKRAKGEKSHRAKITDAQVREIQQSTERTDVLSSKYSVGKSLIISIRNGTSKRVK